jgi:thiosulfate dehydrogenase (quinone) large subunit
MTKHMTDATAPNVVRGEYTAAFLLLRLFVGLRTLLAGVEKFELQGVYSVGNYYQNMGRMAQGITSASFIPLWMSRSFAHSLGYALTLLGVAILLGIRTRAALFLAGLVYVSLSFGLLAVQESEGVAWLGIHVALVAAALLLSRHNRFALWKD